MSNKINTEEINTLIQAFALGCISTDELRRLHLIFQTENDIPWADLGMYQNMLSLLPAISNLEAPDEAVKNSLMEKIKRGSKFTTESEFSEHDYEEVKYIKDEKLKAPQHFAPPIQEDNQLKPIKVTKEDEVDNSIPFIGSDNNEQQSKDNELVESYGGKKPWTSYIPIGLCVISLVFTAIIYVVLSRDISKMREDYQKLKSNVVTFDNMADENKSSLLADMEKIITKATEYYHTPSNKKGGNESFFGFSIPENSASCRAGSYYIERTEKDLLVITAVGRAIGNDKTNPIKYSCTIDNSGKSELMKLN